MLEKTMRQVLTKKVKDWLSSVTDDEVKDAIKNDLVITGGCFTSMIQNEVPKDFDCYFSSKESAKKVAQYYVDQWNEDHKNQHNKLGIPTKVFVLDSANPSEELLKYYNITSLKNSESKMISNTPEDRLKIIFPSDGVVGEPEEARASEELGSPVEVIEEIDEQKADEIIEKEKRPYRPVFMSTNAITLSNGIQIVVRFYGEPGEIHETYDFVHTKAYWYKGTVVIPRDVYECVVNKTLIYTGSKYPVCSVFRVRKFIERGWKINAGQLLKMCMQISQLDLMNIDILEDQLIGVDSLYFMALIDQFRKRKEKDVNFELTTDYVTSIIDKIF